MCGAGSSSTGSVTAPFPARCAPHPGTVPRSGTRHPDDPSPGPTIRLPNRPPARPEQCTSERSELRRTRTAPFTRTRPPTNAAPPADAPPAHRSGGTGRAAAGPTAQGRAADSLERSETHTVRAAPRRRPRRDRPGAAGHGAPTARRARTGRAAARSQRAGPATPTVPVAAPAPARRRRARTATDPPTDQPPQRPPPSHPRRREAPSMRPTRPSAAREGREHIGRRRRPAHPARLPPLPARLRLARWAPFGSPVLAGVQVPDGRGVAAVARAEQLHPSGWARAAPGDDGDASRERDEDRNGDGGDQEGHGAHRGPARGLVSRPAAEGPDSATPRSPSRVPGRRGREASARVSARRRRTRCGPSRRTPTW